MTGPSLPDDQRSRDARRRLAWGFVWSVVSFAVLFAFILWLMS